MGKWAGKCQGSTWLLLLWHWEQSKHCSAGRRQLLLPPMEVSRMMEAPGQTTQKGWWKIHTFCRVREGFTILHQPCVLSLATDSSRFLCGMAPRWTKFKASLLLINCWRDGDLSSEEGWAAPACRYLSERHIMGAGAGCPPRAPQHLQPLEATAHVLTDICTEDVTLITKPLPVAPNVLRRFLLSHAGGVAALVGQEIEIPAVSQRLSLAAQGCAVYPWEDLNKRDYHSGAYFKTRHFAFFFLLCEKFLLVVDLYIIPRVHWSSKSLGYILRQPVRNPSKERGFYKVLSSFLIITLFKALWTE